MQGLVFCVYGRNFKRLSCKHPSWTFEMKSKKRDIFTVVYLVWWILMAEPILVYHFKFVEKNTVTFRIRELAAEKLMSSVVTIFSRYSGRFCWRKRCLWLGHQIINSFELGEGCQQHHMIHVDVDTYALKPRHFFLAYVTKIDHDVCYARICIIVFLHIYPVGSILMV